MSSVCHFMVRKSAGVNRFEIQKAALGSFGGWRWKPSMNILESHRFESVGVRC
jgi:hypothetical protein